MPIGSLINTLLNNRDAVGRFLSLTGGSILYCLSALSIVYGITQIIGPPLARSGILADILPCVGVLNVYELALLAVLVLIVVCRNVTDDAISLVILVALFLVASGMTLGVVAPSGLNVCLVIGTASVLLGLAKLHVLRRYICLRLGVLSVLGLMLILAWNFLGSSLMARPMMARTATDEIRRAQWMVAWLVVLGGAVLILIEAATHKYESQGERTSRPPFLHTHAMAWIFALVLLAAAGFHQYGAAYMFAVDYVLGDFIPLIAIMSLLLLELLRSLRVQGASIAMIVSCTPLALAIAAVAAKATVIPEAISLQVISYPPVVLGLTGLALLWMELVRGRRYLRYVPITYALGVLLTIGRTHELNWQLGGAGLVAVLLLLGIARRNVNLCFAAVIAMAVGLETTDVLARFAREHNLTAFGAAAGIAGLGTIIVALAFGRKTPMAFVLVGTVSAVICVFDYLPKSLQWGDLAVVAVIAVFFTGLALRTRAVAQALVLWIPVFPRAYLFATTMSSWTFVALSFLLLFLGAMVSLFLKRKLAPKRCSPMEQPDD